MRYKHYICIMNIFGKGSDTHGDIINFNNYDQLADTLLIYGH
jgi:hypothetical protein